MRINSILMTVHCLISCVTKCRYEVVFIYGMKLCGNYIYIYTEIKAERKNKYGRNRKIKKSKENQSDSGL